jgi:catalase
MANEVRTTMTTDAGRPVGDHQNSLTAGSRGSIVFEDFLLFERMAHFNLEQIPERVVRQGFWGPRTLRLHPSRHVQMDNRQAL